ncbi:MAG: phosphogluconate dehydrogenase (NADP(+)-dependent, decarboxylating) [Planctomycetia bacterium 21-64-5]|nr:MAG: phosphogluconate dehydrogenase (NADP(+)-dependent, decarboxylating) [Planctomycetia bacterium 21-64-5]HQU41502.1 NADP-dependent phosphogluconate dehydrogenase [Pirellulales bacterium]
MDIAMVGLGVMGRNLVLNMADHGFSVVGYDRDESKVAALKQEGAGKKVEAVSNPDDLVAKLSKPRAVMMLVPAGKPVDSVIRDMLPRLAAGDFLIDGGNSHFTDTDLRAKTLSEKGLQFIGVGISGGEQGARHGPSMMPGGDPKSYERVRPIFEACAAKVDGEPCVAHLGPGSAGHYVKMVHNGIEYGLMQLISETYALMKLGLGLNDDDLHEVYDEWNRGELSSFLLEITANIFRQIDDKTGKRLVDVILDAAKQKGTGMWTSQDAMALQVPTPTIDIAVSMRDLSSIKSERQAASRVLRGPSQKLAKDRKTFVKQLRGALYASMVLTYAQGMSQLRRASEAYGYGLDPETVARIWRGGCIIRAALLEDIRHAFKAKSDLPNLLLDASLGEAVMKRQVDLRAVCCAAAEAGIPAPGMMVSLGYFDGYHSEWLPANLIQAQRDCFGAHTYERVDEKGTFHTEWRVSE